MISYYELLGMIKEGKAPQRVRVKLTFSTSKIYKREDDNGEFNFYYIEKNEEKNEDYKPYLSDCFLESMMFEENIEILDEKKIPEKLNLKSDDWTTPTQCDLVLSNKIDEIIDFLNSKGE